MTALRPSTFEARARRLVPVLAAAGVATGLVGAAVLALATRSLVLSFAGLSGVVLGTALVAPAFTVGLMALVRPVGLAPGRPDRPPRRGDRGARA